VSLLNVNQVPSFFSPTTRSSSSRVGDWMLNQKATGKSGARTTYNEAAFNGVHGGFLRKEFNKRLLVFQQPKKSSETQSKMKGTTRSEEAKASLLSYTLSLFSGVEEAAN
jgi:hypothetical protein